MQFNEATPAFELATLQRPLASPPSGTGRTTTHHATSMFETSNLELQDFIEVDAG